MASPYMSESDKGIMMQRMDARILETLAITLYIEFKGSKPGATPWRALDVEQRNAWRNVARTSPHE